MPAEVPTPYEATDQRHADTRGFIQEGGDKEAALLNQPVEVGTRAPFETTAERHADTRGFIHAGGDKEQAFLEANGFLASETEAAAPVEVEDAEQVPSEVTEPLTEEGESQMADAAEALEEDAEALRSTELSPLAQLALDNRAAKLGWDQEQYEKARSGMLQSEQPRVLKLDAKDADVEAETEETKINA